MSRCKEDKSAILNTDLINVKSKTDRKTSAITGVMREFATEHEHPYQKNRLVLCGSASTLNGSLSQTATDHVDGHQQTTKQKTNYHRKRRYLQDQDGISVQRFHCSVCEYHTLRSDNLQRHMLIHVPLRESMRIHQCDVCEFRTHLKPSLVQHKKTHVDRRRLFQCPACDGRYTTKSAMTAHFKRSHEVIDKAPKSNAKSRQYHCTEPGCEYKTYTKRDVNRHSRSVHGNERPFKCDKCEKSYKLKTHLNRHFKSTHHTIDASETDNQHETFTCLPLNHH